MLLFFLKGEKMKYLLFVIAITILSACASSSAVRDINDEQANLKNKIRLLEIDRNKIRKDLNAIENNGQSLSSEAETLRLEITYINNLIGTLLNRALELESAIYKNSNEISKISEDKNRARKEIKKILNENYELKIRTIEEIRTLEEKYAKEREQTIQRITYENK